MKKLPDAEFEIMKVVWRSEEPITAPMLTNLLKRSLPNKDWKPQTVGTMLTRLEKKGFLRSEKYGRERCYYSLCTEREYLAVGREQFRERFSKSSFSGLVKALYDAGGVTQSDIDELRDWLDSVDAEETGGKK